MKNISLITMGAGNVKALKKTLDSVKGICNEVIYGDLLIFPEDREIVKDYQEEYNLKIIPFKFDYLFHNGFASLLNELSKHTTNDLNMYLNTSEVVEKPEQVFRLINEKFQDYNIFAFDNETDPHHWFRTYDKNVFEWHSLLHEELRPKEGKIEKRCPYFLFRMKDEEKDNDNDFKAKVLNDLKEIIYFRQYIRLVEEPEVRGVTNDFWINFAKDSYDSLKHRLLDKRERYEAFLEGNLEKYLNDIYNNPLFEKERFENTNLIHFQNPDNA